MPILTQPAFGPKLSIGFITGGALVDVWALVWRFSIGPPEMSPMQRFWFLGFLFTGLTFVTIGAFLGRIGREARKAELPPTGSALLAEENIQAHAAANPGGAVLAAPPVGVPAAYPGAAVIAPPPAGAVPVHPSVAQPAAPVVAGPAHTVG